MKNLIKEIQAAHTRIKDLILTTELVRLPWLDAPNRTVWGKLECKQVTGSFKIRGALNSILQIPKEKHIITYSAGNHGLAIAYAAKLLKRNCTIYVPNNASDIKLRKLKKYDVDIERVGGDLYESGLFAKKMAKKTGSAFITPFSTSEIVAGQGTLGLELLNQIDQIDSLIIPLGGGGLLSGVSSYVKSMLPDCDILAVHPEIFQRDLKPNLRPSNMCEKILPSIADGLSVQLDEDCWLLPLLQKVITYYKVVDEEAISIAVYCLMRQESILAEGAGAIGISTLLNDPGGKEISGNTVVLITGSNVSPAIISQALAVDVKDDRLRQLLGLRKITVQGELTINPKKSNGIISIYKPVDSKSKTAVNIWVELLEKLLVKARRSKEKIELHRRFIVAKKLRQNGDAIIALINDIEHLKNQINQDFEKEWCSSNLWELKQKYRIYLKRLGGLMSVLEWVSPSYDQSLEPMFFESSEQLSGIVNYDRYGSINLREFELKIQNILGFDSSVCTLIATSSGQAAYQVIEAFLLREVFSAKDCFVYFNYIYFEALEQISSLPNIKPLCYEDVNIEGFISFVESNDAKVLFVDPVSNIEGLPTFDFQKFARLLEKRDWSDKWVVIDGTLVSGGFNPFGMFNKANHPKILYYESGSKYLQFGLDIQMMGFCIVKKEIASKLVTNRRNSGSTLYKNGIYCFPDYDRQLFLDRMSIITNNTTLLINKIHERWQEKEHIKIGYPKNWQELGWNHGGGIFTIEFYNKGLNNRDKLNTLIDSLIYRCKDHNIPLTKGVSFGFHTPRVSAASAMANSIDPFLRFSISEESKVDINQFAQIINDCIYLYLEKYFYEKATSLGS